MKHTITTFLLLLMSQLAYSNLIIVNSNEDTMTNNGDCTLREALSAANFNVAIDSCAAGSASGDLIWLLVSATNDAIQLESQLPIIDGVEIQGPGIDSLVLFPSDTHNDSLFQINTDDDVSLKGFRIGGAKSSAIDVVNIDQLNIENMSFLNNSASSDNDFGGAIHADTTFGTAQSIRELNINNSRFSGNSAQKGGAIASSGEHLLSITGSIFENNSAISGGGAILKFNENESNIQESVLEISTSQFLSNNSNTTGGAIETYVQNLSIDSSLFHKNTGQSILMVRHSLASIENSTFAENAATKTVEHQTFNAQNIPSEMTLKFNTFINNENLDVLATGIQSETFLKANVFESVNGISCQGISINSLGSNVESTGASCSQLQSDFPGTDPELLPLDHYGTDVLHAPPSPVSLLVDNASGCNDNDISGIGRAFDGNASGGVPECDIGAVERPDAYGLSVSFSGNGEGQINLNEFNMVCFSESSCFWPLAQGESFSFQPSPFTGSTFINWSGSCSGDASCNITMDNNKSLSAEFVKVLSPVTLNVDKTTNDITSDVYISSTPAGIDCGKNCSADFIENDVIDLVALSDNNTKIDSWSGCDSVSADLSQCSVVLTETTTVEINYSLKNTFTLTVQKNQSDLGTDVVVSSAPPGIDCGGICDADYFENEVVVLTASPSDDTVIDRWMGCDSVSKDDMNCTVAMNGDVTVDIFYSKNSEFIFDNGFE